MRGRCEGWSGWEDVRDGEMGWRGGCRDEMEDVRGGEMG